MGEGQREKGKERIPNSTPSVEPDAGLNPTTLGYDLSQNQELDAQPTEPPRHPKMEELEGDST